MYFDDFEVMLTEGKVVQSNNYYPFGLQQNTSWTRAEQTPNAHKFNAATEYNDFTDTYDTPFRQYDPATGRFNGVDALAHMTPTLTPYRFGFNNPVSFNDPTGLNERPVELDDPNLRAPGGQASIISGADNDFSMIWFSGSMGPGSGRYWSDGIHYSDWTPNGGSQMYRNGIAAGLYDLGGKLFGFNSEGNMEVAKEKDGKLGFYEDQGDGYWRGFETRINGETIQLKEFIRQATFVAVEGQNGGVCPTCLDPSTLGRNIFGLHYPGGNNPQTYPDDNGNRKPDYTTNPKSLAGYPAIGHDRRYDNLKIAGASGLFFDTRAIGADWQFVKEELSIATTPYFDPVTRLQSGVLGVGLGLSALGKTVFGLANPQSISNVIMWYSISNVGVTNAPSE